MTNYEKHVMILIWTFVSAIVVFVLAYTVKWDELSIATIFALVAVVAVIAILARFGGPLGPTN